MSNLQSIKYINIITKFKPFKLMPPREKRKSERKGRSRHYGDIHENVEPAKHVIPSTQYPQYLLSTISREPRRKTWNCSCGMYGISNENNTCPKPFCAGKRPMSLSLVE